MKHFRRILSLLLTAALLCAAIPASAASGFDISLFNLQDFTLDMAGDDYGFINPNTNVNALRDICKIYEISLSSPSYFSYVMPYVYVSIEKNEVDMTSFTLKIQLANDIHRQLRIHTVEFSVGGKVYVFTSEFEDSNCGVKANNNTYYENIFIYIDEESRVMMDAIVANGAPVYVTAIGDNATISFTMDKHVVDTIVKMYETYVAANGFSICLPGTPMVSQSPLEKFLGETTALATPVTDFGGRNGFQWLQNEDNRALLASLLAYDMFTANPAWSDVLGYAYGSCYVGQTDAGDIHVAIQTAARTYYIVRSAEGTTVSVKSGNDRLDDNALAAAMTSNGVTWTKVSSQALLASVVAQTTKVAEYNVFVAAGGGL